MSGTSTLSWVVALLAATLLHLAIAAIPVGSSFMAAADDRKKPLEVAFSKHEPPSSPEPLSRVSLNNERQEEHLAVTPPAKAKKVRQDDAAKPSRDKEKHEPRVELEPGNEAELGQEAFAPAEEESDLDPDEAASKVSYAALEHEERSDAGHESDHEQALEEGLAGRWQDNRDDGEEPSKEGLMEPLASATASSRPSRQYGPSPNMEDYGRILSRSIQEKQRYPMAARRMRLEGEVYLRVRVLPEGELDGTPDVSLSSGVQSLDREAVRMVQSAAPFPPLPDGFSGRSAEFPVPVRFELR